MKNLKLFLFTFSIIISSLSFGQEHVDKMKATTLKTFHYESSAENNIQKIKIIEKRKPTSVLGETVRPDLEHVTKLVSVDNDSDNAFDRYIVLRYKKTLNDSFKLVNTKKGLAVLINNKTKQYIVGEGTYIINNTDNDYFVVDEFENI